MAMFKAALFLCVALLSVTASANNLDVLFLGDNGHHQPRARFEQLQPVLAKRNIRLVYTDQMADLNADNLANYDALLVFANIDRIESSQETALLDYVKQGGGFVPLHCATYCFRNSDAVVALMGGQFKRHGTGVFRTTIDQSDHPIMQGFGGFESWDETYVHHLHNEKNRTVLAYRVDVEGREPWTWIRTDGRGRVSIPLGDTTSELGETPAFKTWLNAASAGLPARMSAKCLITCQTNRSRFQK